ncbi:MAG: hypothetical protein GDA39_09925 [Hyphomonadaceae bacterium]|nr:hypothetical protein [Hyphomonadaceae bacterium]
MRGGPDTLRSVHGGRDSFTEQGFLETIIGGAHMMVADRGENGRLYLRFIHQFGAATRDDNSPHYEERAVLFASGDWKVMPR